MSQFTTQQLADGFSVTSRNIRDHISKLDLNLDYEVRNSTSAGGKTYLINQLGVKKLAEVINTPKAKEFANQLAVSESFTDPKNPLFWQKLTQQNQIAINYLQEALEKKEAENNQLKDSLVKTETLALNIAKTPLNVEKVKDYKGYVKAKKDDLGKAINYYVYKLFQDKGRDYSQAHVFAKEAYKASGKGTLPHYAEHFTLQQKESYLDFLANYDKFLIKQ
jgi:hypothetical protein